MHSGEQTSLWEQSDLLDLVSAAQGGRDAVVDQAEVDERGRQDPAGPLSPSVPSPGDAAEGSASAGLSQAETASEEGHSFQRPNQALAEGPAADRVEAAGTADSAPSPAPADISPGAAAAPPAPRRAESDDDDLRPLASAAATRTDRAEARPKAHAEAPAMSEAGAGPAAEAEPPGLPACPQRLLIIDTETTALSPQQGQCIEVGAVLFDVASRSVLMQVSFLLPCDHNPAQSVNGIPAAVSRLPQPWRSGLSCFEAMVADADALLAHNATFDRQWFGNGSLPALEKPWICSMEDIRWPADRQLRATPSVRDLALAYGVPVWAAHRALTDCIYLVQVFQRCDELEPLLQAALEPRRLVRARLSYDERQLAKDAGFRWNEPVTKAWSRRLSEREIASLPFPVDPVETDEPGRQRREGSPPLWRRSA